ncbi:Uncharacterised protein [Bordetella pertussis]|nr:Uncharacterised protein [Bordetella pertussis]
MAAYTGASSSSRRNTDSYRPISTTWPRPVWLRACSAISTPMAPHSPEI